MPKTNINDISILKSGSKLKARKISKKEFDKFTKKYNKANEKYLKSVEMRKQGTPEQWRKQIEI